MREPVTPPDPPDLRAVEVGTNYGAAGVFNGPVIIGERAPAAGPLGLPLAQVSDPFALQVHPVIEVASSQEDLPALPVYVPRAHDEILDQVIDEVLVDGYTGARMVVLVGGSSTGKTRALWETVHRLEERSPGWRLWRPRPRALLEALLEGTGEGGLRPLTVLWLNELQGFLDQPGSGLGEDLAAALLDLVSAGGRGPILVVGTLWPEHWRSLTGDPALGQDLHAQARALLAGRDVRIAEEFSSPRQALAQTAASADPRWKEALDRGRGRPTQYLAGGYNLVRRYENAEPALRAVLDAAGDARRLGHPGPLPIEFLRTAAEGYLSDDIWQQLQRDQRETWFDACLEELERTSRGTTGPLTPTRPASGGPPTGRLELADFLEQHLRRTRRCIAPPATLWDSAATHLADPAIHTALSAAAYARGRFRHAVVLARRAADAGDAYALRDIARKRARDGDRHGAEQLYHAAAEAGDAQGLRQLLRMREEDGDPQGAEQLARAAADATWALSELARIRKENGDRQGAEHLYRAAGDTQGLLDLAQMCKEDGDRQGAEHLYRAAADAGDAQGVAQLLLMRVEDGDRQAAQQLARAMAVTADTRNTRDLRQLARTQEPEGDRQAAEQLARTADDTRGPFIDFARLRKEAREWAQDLQGAERQARAAADSGDTRGLLELAQMREHVGDRQGAEQLARAVADAGDTRGLRILARFRDEDGDRQGAEQLYRQAADAGDPQGLIQLALMREVDGDRQGAEQLAFTVADAGGDTQGLRILGRMRKKDGDWQGAERLYRAATDSGDPLALRELVRMRGALEPPGKENMRRFGLTADGQTETPWSPADFGPSTRVDNAEI